MKDIDKENSKKSGWDKSQLASGFAVILSLISLFVSVMELSSIQDQQRANVWPYLQMTGSYTQDGFAIELQNKGVGPALVNEFVLSYKGETYQELDKMILASVGEEDAFSYDVYKAANPSQSVIASGENLILFSVPWEIRTRKLIEQWNDNANISICYCSIHEECWQTELSQRSNQLVKSCS